MVVEAKIAAYLHDKGIKKCFVAQRAGIPVSKFSKIINGHTSMDSDDFIRVCEVLNVSPELFLNSDEKIE